MRIRGLLVIALGFGASAALAQKSVEVRKDRATIIEVRGDVKVTPKGGDEAPAQRGAQLNPGDELYTGFNSSAKLTFLDRSVMEVESNTQIEVASSTQRRFQVKLGLGEVKAQVTVTGARRPDVRVETPTATASVRGTKINSIAYNPAYGTRIEMGQEGELLAQSRHRGAVKVHPFEKTEVATTLDRPTLPEEELADEHRTLVVPVGLTKEEVQDIKDVGIPQTTPQNTPGAGTAVTLSNSAQGSVVTINLPPLP